MGKDKYRKLPATLQSELTEYSSLLRALRASDTLDVAANLHKPPPTRPSRAGRRRSSHESSDNDVDDTESPVDDGRMSALGTEDYPPPTSPLQSRGLSVSEPGSSMARRGSSRKRKQQSPSTQTRKRKRDNWTRWPLRPGDVPKPEWSLEEEVAAVVSRVMKESEMDGPGALVDDLDDISEHKDAIHGMDVEEHASQEGASDDEQVKDEVVEEDGDHQDEDEDEEFVSSLVPYLTEFTRHLLSATLILLSRHTPPRPGSMQNRIEPIDWRGVVDILSSFGDRSFVNEGLLQDVTTRLQSIYPDQDPEEPAQEVLAAKRISMVDAAREKLKKALATADDDLFEFTQPPPPPAPPPQRLTRSRSKGKGKEKVPKVGEVEPHRIHKVVRKSQRKRKQQLNEAGPSTVRESPSGSPSF
ncbi:hypothetical protein BDN72DRAFT_831970 [Pluteus cervinus]|uniref:Uncharacterized protein n=1 Tax=Pluteus cervinus TaxID=181527 RepID=A0ACD3BDC4_9AGAR|nr:hypothetical protein BDN72DRAFT_831970 [Pluteus cervinus]